MIARVLIIFGITALRMRGVLRFLHLSHLSPRIVVALHGIKITWQLRRVGYPLFRVDVRDDHGVPPLAGEGMVLVGCPKDAGLRWIARFYLFISSPSDRICSFPPFSASRCDDEEFGNPRGCFFAVFSSFSPHCRPLCALSYSRSIILDHFRSAPPAGSHFRGGHSRCQATLGRWMSLLCG